MNCCLTSPTESPFSNVVLLQRDWACNRLPKGVQKHYGCRISRNTGQCLLDLFSKSALWRHELESVILMGPFQHPRVFSDCTAFVPSLSSLQLVSQPLALVFPTGCAAWLAGCPLMLEGSSWEKGGCLFCVIPAWVAPWRFPSRQGRAVCGGRTLSSHAWFIASKLCDVRTPAMLPKRWHCAVHWNALF